MVHKLWDEQHIFGHFKNFHHFYDVIGNKEGTWPKMAKNGICCEKKAVNVGRWVHTKKTISFTKGAEIQMTTRKYVHNTQIEEGIICTHAPW